MRDFPEPPTNPKEPEYRHKEHAFSMDRELLDGPGKKEVETVDFTVFTVLHRECSCDRDGCGAKTTERMLFAMEDLVDDFDERDVESVGVSAEIVDYNMLKVDSPRNGKETKVEPRKKITSGGSFACNGKPKRTSYL